MIAYIGGKYRMAKWISNFIPEDTEIYGEIFGGAFWTFLNSNIYKLPNLQKVYYNDFNRLMVNFIACSKDFNNMINIAEDFPSQNKELFDNFLKEIILMEKNNSLNNINIPDHQLAMKYAYLLTQVFSGVGIKDNTKMMDLQGKYKPKFDVYINRLQNIEFQNKLSKITDTLNLDFEKAIEKLDSEKTFLYFDPPYYKTENYYSFHDFNINDHLRLANAIKKMKGKWALSYYYFPELEEWFPKDKFHWEQKDFVKAASAKKGVKQNIGTEVLIMNY